MAVIGQVDSVWRYPVKSMCGEQLPEIFATHQPVCWNCHIAESFRRLHPELVTDRPLEPKRMM